MNGVPLDARAVRAALVGRITEVTFDLLGEPNPKFSNKRELRFGHKGSLSVILTGRKAGAWYDHENGIGGDLIDLIERERNVRFSDAINYAQQFIGFVPTLPTQVPVAPSQPTPGAGSDQNGHRGLELWRAAGRITGTVAARYLAARGIAVGPEIEGDVLRFHPACLFGDLRHPCLLAIMRDVRTDEPRAVQRTALTPDGTKIGRMVLGPKTGTAIKFSSDENVTQGLTVGEGAETVLAGMALGFVPAWALGDARNVATFPVLSGIECLTILVDHDASGTGQRAALECSARWTTAGHEVRRVIPYRVGHDMNDVALVRRAR